jgi:hypothetical protein
MLASTIHDCRRHQLRLVSSRNTFKETVFNESSRITYINSKGVCIIGMEKIAMMPLIIFEAIVNVSCSPTLSPTPPI